MNERKVLLTESEQAALAPIKNKIESASSTDKFPALVSEKTCVELRNSLNMYSSQFNSQEEQPFYIASSMAKNLLEGFSEDSKDAGTKIIMNQLGDWLGKTIPQGKDQSYKYAQDAATVGFSLVLLSFSMQFGNEFMENLRKVNRQDTENVFIIPKEVGGFSIIEKAERRSRMPKYQIFLKDLIGEFADNIGYGAQLESGAILAFGVVDKLWPKLKPGANPKV